MDNLTTMRTYRHDGPGGPVRATSAASAALALARRVYGSRGSVESLLFVARTWASNGYGGSKMASKTWAATLILPPDDRQRWLGGYSVPRQQVTITEGSGGTYVSSGSDTAAAVRGSGIPRWQTAPVRPPVLMTTGAWRHNPGPPVAYDAAREAEHARLAREAALSWQAEKQARRSLVGAL